VLRAGVGGECGSYLLLFRSDLDSAGSSVFPVGPRRCGLFLLRSEGKEGERDRDWPGFPRNGRERARKTGKAGKPGFPRNGRERARKKREGRGSLAMGGNGPGKRRKRESRGSLAMGGNGPGESGKAGVPSQWEGTGQESGESGLLVGSEAESESVLELG
jgi:hypothetical protein